MMTVSDYVKTYAVKHKIHVFKQGRYPTCSDVKGRMVLINVSEIPKKIMPFSIAHEIGHIIHKDNGKLYNAAPCNGVLFEESATVFAIQMLYSYCEQYKVSFDDASDFMTKLGIPQQHLYLVEVLLKGYNIFIVWK